LVTQIREKQNEEANESIVALEKSELLAKARKEHYSGLLSGVTADRIGLPLNVWESAGLSLESAAIVAYGIGMAASTGAATTHLVPNKEFGSSGNGGHAVTGHGGGHLGKSGDSAAKAFQEAAHILSMGGGLSRSIAGFVRRKEEWELQLKLAERDQEQIQQQIVVARLRKEISERELTHHARQIEKSEVIRTYMQDKFTNEELYGWMTGQVSGIYFQAYKLAYDVAKQAERACRFELGIKESDYIQSDNWDRLNKGLLAGEKLFLDLKRLEAAHLERNRRDYELTRHISLLQLDPLALISLRTACRCTFKLPEVLLDMDCPGHYFRRIKTVAVSIPCVTGPYASVNCTLTLLKSSVRTSATVNGGNGYERKEDEEDSRFRDDFGSIQSIVTSSAQNDSGLFETNLHDQRYLPFEGAGAISTWRLELPDEIRQFDYDSISDVILHLRYTAREGGFALRNAATTWVNEQVQEAVAAGSARLLSIRHDFPAEWVQFKAQELSSEQPTAMLNIALKEEHYPFWALAVSKKVLKKVWIFAVPATVSSNSIEVHVPVNTSEVATAQLDKSLRGVFGDQLLGGALENGQLLPALGQWNLHLSDNLITDLWLVLEWGSQGS
jgi:hypothetical protein